MQLSSSALSIFERCERCFWLDRNKKITRPRGISSSLPIEIDSILKNKLDTYRGSLPPVLADMPELAGYQLYGGSDLSKMRNWSSNPLRMEDSKGNKLVGAFDDLLHNPEKGLYAILDVKTKGSEPDQAYCEKYYQKQFDIYTRFLEVGKRKPASFGIILYFWSEPGDAELITFKTKAFLMKPNTQAAEDLFLRAITCLEGPLPPKNNDCEYCSFIQKMVGFDLSTENTVFHRPY